MSSLGLHTKEFNHPTTDWDDKMRELGLKPPLETDEPPAEDGASASHAPLAAEERGGAAGEEEAELQAIRERRLEELKREAGGESERSTGHILEITRDQFVAEVNQAGDGVPVVVFLSKARHYLSSYTRVLLEKLAAKFPDVKFIQMGHTDCIDGYPAANLPTLLIYKDDDLLRQCARPCCCGLAGISPIRHLRGAPGHAGGGGRARRALVVVSRPPAAASVVAAPPAAPSVAGASASARSAAPRLALTTSSGSSTWRGSSTPSCSATRTRPIEDKDESAAVTGGATRTQRAGRRSTHSCVVVAAARGSGQSYSTRTTTSKQYPRKAGSNEGTRTRRQCSCLDIYYYSVLRTAVRRIT